MNTPAPLFNAAAPAASPTLDEDDEPAQFNRAIDKIDGLHRGPGGRQPRRIHFNRRSVEACFGSETPSPGDNQKSRGMNFNCRGGSNSAMLNVSSSTSAEDMLVDFPARSDSTEPPVGKVGAAGHSSPTTIGELIFQRLSTCSLRSLSSEVHVAAKRDGGVPSFSSFTTDVNFGGFDDDGNSLDPSDFPTAPRIKKRTREFCEQLNDIERPSLPRRRYESSNDNLRGIINDINGKLGEDHPDFSSSRLSNPQDQATLVGMMSRLLQKPSPQRQHSAATITTTASTVEGDQEEDTAESNSSFASVFEGDDRFIEDESGWVTLASLLMKED
jgi:hypothetical protein